MNGPSMTQFRVSDRNVERVKAWLARKTSGPTILRDKKGNSGLYELTFDEALDELLTEVGF